eukprot:PhM_4_TR6865/c0_g1_i1/m.28922
MFNVFDQTRKDAANSLYFVLQAVCYELAVDRAYVFVPRSDSDLQCIAVCGKKLPPRAAEIRAPMMQSASGRCFATGFSVNAAQAHETETNVVAQHDARSGFTAQNILCCPIYASDKKRTIGVVQLLNKFGGQGTFSPEDESRLYHITPFIGYLVENYKLDSTTEAYRATHTSGHLAHRMDKDDLLTDEMYAVPRGKVFRTSDSFQFYKRLVTPDDNDVISGLPPLVDLDRCIEDLTEQLTEARTELAAYLNSVGLQDRTIKHLNATIREQQSTITEMKLTMLDSQPTTKAQRKSATTNSDDPLDQALNQDPTKHTFFATFGSEMTKPTTISIRSALQKMNVKLLDREARGYGTRTDKMPNVLDRRAPIRPMSGSKYAGTHNDNKNGGVPNFQAVPSPSRAMPQTQSQVSLVRPSTGTRHVLAPKPPPPRRW